jgi:hypothetical protein
MARPNMIVVGVVVAGPLILGLEGYALYRSYHKRPPGSAEVERPAPSELPLAPPVAALSTALPIAPSVPETSPAEPAPGGAPEPTEGDGGEPEGAFRQRQHLLAEHRGEIIRTADEQVFDILNLSDSKRAAIRAIDEVYVHAVRPIEDLPPNADPRSRGADLNAEQTRRAAIADVLGADGMRAFTFEDHKAQRRARNQLRTQWVRGL